MIKEGVMVGPASQQAAEIGRQVHEAHDAVVSVCSGKWVLVVQAFRPAVAARQG